MPFFTGTVSHQLDGKNRIRIPAKFRAELGEDVTFARGDEKCIFVYTKDTFNNRLQEIYATCQGNPAAKKAFRLLTSSVETMAEDEQGRTMLSNMMREHLGVTKENRELVTIGVGDHLEIWLKSTYEAYESDMSYSEAYALVGF